MSPQSCPRTPPGVSILKFAEDLLEVHLCFMFSPWSVGVLLGGVVYFDNGIVEGKGVWNELWVSFRTSALISANKHISQ